MLRLTPPPKPKVADSNSAWVTIYRLRAENVPKMRDYIQKSLDDGMALPTPEEVREAVGPVLGFAFEVLNEFPEHGEAHRAREMASD